MDTFQNNFENAFKHRLDYDIDEAREAIERKLQYLSNSLDRNKGMSQRSYASQLPIGRKTDYNIMLDEPIRRNGLTPRSPSPEPLFMTKDGNDSMMTMQQRQDDKRAVRPAALYHCEFCGDRFNIKSLLIAHRRVHDLELRERMKPQRQAAGSILSKRAKQCEYCDRLFDLERTLHIHQLNHCSKIPPRIRRSLDITVLEHENKAPLPSFHKLKAEPAKVLPPVKKVTFTL